MDEDLVPLGVQRSLSVPISKSESKMPRSNGKLLFATNLDSNPLNNLSESMSQSMDNDA